MSDSGQPEDVGPEVLDRRVTGDRYRRRALLTLAALFPVVFLVFMIGLLSGFGSRQPTTPGPPSIAERLALAKASGQPAQPFTMNGVQGKSSISLGDFSGRVVVLNFWASWCPLCRQEAPQLQAVWRSYQGRGVQFLGVDHRDSRGAAAAFQRQFGITYPSVFDPQGKLSADYGLLGIPTSLIIDGRRRVLYRFLGRIDAPLLTAALDRVLSERTT